MTKDEMTFEKCVEEFTGRPIEYHTRAGTTGLEFGRYCWDAALRKASTERMEAAPAVDSCSCSTDKLGWDDSGTSFT